MQFRKLKLNWRYGLAELVIVVAGVLIALAADGWLQTRQDRATELQYIQRISVDLTKDTAALSSIMALTRMRAEYAEVVVTAYAVRSHSGSAADFIRAVEFGDYFSYPSYSRTGVEDLISTGNLRLIRSAEVKDAISQYYGTIEWTEQFRELFRPVQLALMERMPEFLELEHRYALFNEGISASCGPNLSCVQGIPWASPELSVTKADADEVLRRLLAYPEVRPLYANMARIQGSHYANLSNIKQLATQALSILHAYVQEAW